MSSAKSHMGPIAHGPSPAALGATLAVLIAVLGALGAAVAADLLSASSLDLDGEGNVTAAFSAILLVAAGVGSIAVAILHVGPTLAWRAFGGILILMALDEALVLHERVESALGVDWQLLYAPLILLCGGAWLVVLTSLQRNLAASATMLTGGAAWLASQILERIQWREGDVKVDGYALLMTIEEILEMAGSALFLLAAYIVLKASYSHPPRGHADSRRR